MDDETKVTMAATGPVIEAKNLPVLVVEDNGLNQKVAILLLQRLGMSGEIAKNGVEAVAAVAQKQYCLILMDCHMPEMDGFEATAAIRAYQATHGLYTPIIAITALTTDGDRQRCLDAGMDDYMPKPIERDLLECKIDHWLEKAAQVRYNHSQSRLPGKKNSGPLLQPREIPSGIDQLDFVELEEFYGQAELSLMLQRFMQDTLQKIILLEVAVREHNEREVVNLCNLVKAACITIGAKQLARLFTYEQQAAAKSDWIEASECLISIQRSFAHSKNQFQCGIVTEENPPLTDFSAEQTDAISLQQQSHQHLRPI